VELECYLDSELVVKQMRGEYKVSDANIKNLKAQILPVLQYFKEVRFTHIPREQNKHADRLVNLILDTKLADDL
jgi:ribonuclease HI